jgi:hypothetical protein
MKRVLGLVLALASTGFVLSAEAKPANTANENITIAANSAPQWQRDRYRHNRRFENRRRSVTRTRLVRYGRRLYRETYVITYRPNGRTDTRLISRQRVG